MQGSQRNAIEASHPRPAHQAPAAPLQARGFMDSCGLVPDDLAAQLVRTRLGQKDAQQHGWLLDGYPRTAAQAEALAAAGVRPDVVLCLEVRGPRRRQLDGGPHWRGTSVRWC